MFIPKSKMPFLSACIEAIYDSPLGHGFDEEDVELIAQLSDKISLCQHGDAPFLEIDVCYANNPTKPRKIIHAPSLCDNCGSELINGSCYTC